VAADEFVGRELLEDVEIAFALHLFVVVANNRVGGFARCAAFTVLPLSLALSNRPVICLQCPETAM